MIDRDKAKINGTFMIKLPTLKPGDAVEIIAPASRCSDKQLSDLKDLLQSWQLNCIIDQQIFGNDLLCANTDDYRFQSLKKALLNPDTKAIICARGGYGSMRLIPKLLRSRKPRLPAKLFIGMSDITALNLFLTQKWKWPVLHGALSQDKFSEISIHAHKSLLLSEEINLTYTLKPLNNVARQSEGFLAPITGGNLSIIQTSIGTAWQLDGRDKIIFLEDVDERGYRVDRMLAHLEQAGIFKKVKAIIFGDFTGGTEKDGRSFVWPVLERFAEYATFPVLKVEGIGHGPENYPLPLGVHVTLELFPDKSMLIYSNN